MFKCQVEREKLWRQERQKLSTFPGKVESEKMQRKDGEIVLMQEERLLFYNKQKGTEIRSRCRKVCTFDSRKPR